MPTKRAPSPAVGTAGPPSPYLRLRDLIIDGSLAPGGPLVEVSLAERLGVSRTPIRDALQRLHQEGLVAQAAEGRLYKFIVAPLTAEDGESLCHITGELEGLAAHAAARLPAAQRRALVAEMRAANADLEAMAGEAEPHPRAFLELDRTFHRLFVVAAAGPRLRAMHAALEPQAERYWRVYASMPPGAPVASAAEHAGIVAALDAGDAEAAREAARRNWLGSAERLLRVIERSGSRGTW